MRRMQFFVIFCAPTLLSAILTFVLSILILASANFGFLRRSNILYEIIYGSGSSPDLIRESNIAFNQLNQAVLGNNTLNKILFFGLWMLIGLFVYALLTEVGRTVNRSKEEFDSLKYVNAQKEVIEKDYLYRFLLRSLGLLSLGVYMYVFMKFLYPYGIYAVRVGLNENSRLIGWLSLILGGIVTVISLHVFVVLIRLATLRIRIFGIQNA